MSSYSRALLLGAVTLVTGCSGRAQAPLSPGEPLLTFEGEVDVAAGRFVVASGASARGLFGPLVVEKNGAPGLDEPNRVELVTESVGPCAGPDTFGGVVRIHSSYPALTDLFVQITSITPAVGFGPHGPSNESFPPFDERLGLWFYEGGPGSAETWCFDALGGGRFTFRGRVFGDVGTRLPDPSPWASCGPREWRVSSPSGGSECECQPRFTGPSCESCAAGYGGPDCTECAPGFLPSDRLGGGFDPDPADPRVKSYAATAWELRCAPAPTRTCAEAACGPQGACEVVDGYAVCRCAPGSTGGRCEDCAPGYERHASGACVLGVSCRDALCGGAGDCVDDGAGGLSCDCDDPLASPLGCGAPVPEMLDEAGAPTPWRSLYPGESVELDVPLDAAGAPVPIDVRTGPARVVPCDRTCAPGADVRLVADAIVDEAGVSFAKVRLSPPGPVLELDLAIVPPRYVPISGLVRAELKPVYDNLLWFMKARGVRGAALGISKGGFTVAKNGFGFRDLGLDDDPWAHEGEGGPRVWPTTPFRIASLSKPITAAVVRAEAAAAGVDVTSGLAGHRAADWIDASTGVDPADDPVGFPYSTGGFTDARWDTLTIQQLINHHAGYVRDAGHAPTSGAPALNAGTLPNTGGVPGNGNAQAPQNDLSYLNTSFDVFFSVGLYAIPALGLTNDPRLTFDKMIRLANGVAFDYSPGGAVGGDGYSNYGYGLLGRIAEGLRGETYDPDEVGVPFGAGPYPKIARDLLCPLGIPASQLFAGGGRPSSSEPAYRELDGNGNVLNSTWDVSDPRRLRWVSNANGGYFLACVQANPADCDPNSVVGWGTAANTDRTNGAAPMGVLAPVGGWVSTPEAYLRFARRYRTSTGAPNQGAGGSGSPLAGVAAYVPGSVHGGSLPGTWTWVWQLAGTNATITMPTPTVAWSETLPASAPTDNNGAVIVTENLLPGRTCTLPSDVAVTVFLNSRADYRAPIGAVSSLSNSNQSSVWGRVRDFVFDGVCDVDAANDWPTMSLDTLGLPPSCP